MELRDAVLQALAEMDDLVEETNRLVEQSKHTNIKPLKEPEKPLEIVVPEEKPSTNPPMDIRDLLIEPEKKPKAIIDTLMDIIEPKKVEPKEEQPKIVEPVVEPIIVETVEPIKVEKSIEIPTKVEKTIEIPKEEIKEPIETPKLQKSNLGITDDLHSEKAFLQRLRERLLVLFDGLQDDSMVNKEIKFDMVINFLEYMLAMSEKRLDELK